MHELHVDSNKIRDCIHLRQQVKNSLLNDVVERVKELMVDLMGLIREVKLVNAIHVIKSLLHQYFAHRGPFRQEEVPVNSSALSLWAFYNLKVDLLQSFFDGFHD